MSELTSKLTAIRDNLNMVKSSNNAAFEKKNTATVDVLTAQTESIENIYFKVPSNGIKFNNAENIYLSNFDTSNVTSVRTIFYNCSSLQELNVTGWNISKITNVNNTTNMFYNCTSLNKLILGNVSQSTYNWWVARLTSAGIQSNVTIEATIV